eukprot:7042847-Pyramimonas_sp.AAC.2
MQPSLPSETVTTLQPHALSSSNAFTAALFTPSLPAKGAPLVLSLTTAWSSPSPLTSVAASSSLQNTRSTWRGVRGGAEGGIALSRTTRGDQGNK